MEITIYSTFAKLVISGECEEAHYRISIPLFPAYVIEDTFGNRELYPAEYYDILLPAERVSCSDEPGKLIVFLDEVDSEGKIVVYTAVALKPEKRDDGSYFRKTINVCAKDIWKAFQ